MLPSLVPGGLHSRTLRTVALIVAQVVTLGLGAAGAVAWQNGGEPAWLALRAIVQETATDESCLSAAAGTDLSVADIAERANPAVVTITNYIDPEMLQAMLPEEADEELAPEAEEPVRLGTGSGFIIDASGLVVTNSHVVVGAAELRVRLFDGTTVPGTVLGLDDPRLLDVALVQLDLPDGVDVPGVLTLGDSDSVRPGDEVVAIGSALGSFTNTVTHGMVNAVGRDLQGYGLRTLIQHDAEIWQGNSGGPLLNMQGEVIGINSAGLRDNQLSMTSPADIGFAVSSNSVQSVVDIVRTTGGTVARPFIGIVGEGIEIGHRVIEIVPDTPAAVAGLQEGDVITAIDGEGLDARTSLLDVLLTHSPGETVTLEIERDGEALTLDLELATRPVEGQ